MFRYICDECGDDSFHVSIKDFNEIFITCCECGKIADNKFTNAHKVKMCNDNGLIYPEGMR